MSDLRLHNDGNDFMCMDCCEVVHRTRDNPYPKHECCCGQRWTYRGCVGCPRRQVAAPEKRKV